MINITNQLKNDCNSSSITYREYIVIKGTTQQIDIKGKLFQTAYKDTHFIGTFNLGYLKFTTENNINYKKKELEYYKEINGEPIRQGKFIVTEVKDSDTKEEVSVTAYDYGLKFANPYKSDLDFGSGKITLYKVLQECCSKCKVILKNKSITNGNFIVDSNQFEGQTFGDVISAIAGISCNFATITNDGELELVFKKETNEIIEDYIELDDKRDTQPITSVALGMSNVEGENVVLEDTNLIEQYGEHWLILNDNPFAYTQTKRQQLIDGIFNKIKGFSYSSFVSEYTFKPYLQLGDLIQFKNKKGELVNSIILRREDDYDNITFSAPSIIKAAVDYKQPVSAIEISKRTELIVNKQDQKITSVVEQIGDRTGKKNTITQDLDRIESSISDIADITTSAEGFGSIKLDNLNVGEPIRLEVRPNIIDITLLYPSSKLFPSNTLFMPTRRIVFENEKEKIYYELPANLRYLDSETFDQFVLDYETKQCYVERKVGIREDMTKYKLPTPEKNIFEYPTIILQDGNYRVYMETFDNAYIKMRAVAKNIYTDQFATKVELTSSIKQTAEDISLNVDKKLTNYSTTTEMNSAINISADNITSKVSQTYETKANANTKYSEIKQTTDSITSTVEKNYATKKELNTAKSQIKQTTDSISTEVRKKVGNNEIISKINQSPESVKVNANKISLERKNNKPN